jgi:hypothetical protein
MELNFQDPNVQLYACERLYLEEGTKHWEESRSKWEK